MNYGRYQILREVGRGAMGVVYEARDPNIGRVVALKVLRQDRITTDKFVNRFLKEAKVVGRLSHPRIVTIYDVGEDQGTIYIAMEFLEGIPLSDLINKKRFDADEVVKLGIQIASSIGYAHQKGVVHRDIKPSNIIVSPDGQIKITDFGIAHIEDATATLQTQAGEIMGTPAYMSPEQVQGNPVDCRSDLFSLGIILYELSTGTRPFGGEGKGMATIFNEIMLVTPHEPHKESPPIPKGLSKIIMKALEKEPDKRFQNGIELANALQECLKEEEQVVEAPKPSSKNTMRFGISIAATLTAAIVAGGIYFFSRHKESASEKQQTRPALVKPASPPVKSAAPPVKLAPQPVKPAPVPVKPAPVKPIPVIIAPPPASQQTGVKKRETKPSEIPNKTGTKPIVSLSPATAPKPLPKFAFLKVRSTPKGASVYINETLKGNAPVTLKLGLGEYRVRLSRPGYSDSENKFKIEKMTEYSLTVKLKLTK
jgi:serine/threonine protein kinase